MTKTLYLFRHGETSWNVEERFQGSTAHVPLNETGILQAEALAQSLKHAGITIVYSSPLERAAQTAAIVGKMLSTPVVHVADLQERGYGKLEGRTRAEAFAEDSELQPLMEQYKNFHFITSTNDYGVEPIPQVKQRITQAIRHIAKTTEHAVIGIASHGAILRNFLEEIQGHDEFESLKNVEILVITYCPQADAFTFVERRG